MGGRAQMLCLYAIMLAHVGVFNTCCILWGFQWHLLPPAHAQVPPCAHAGVLSAPSVPPLSLPRVMPQPLGVWLPPSSFIALLEAGVVPRHQVGARGPPVRQADVIGL